MSNVMDKHQLDNVRKVLGSEDGRSGRLTQGAGRKLLADRDYHVEQLHEARQLAEAWRDVALSKGAVGVPLPWDDKA